MAARFLDITPEEYHRDPLPEPSLSASIAHTLVSESPAHAWLEHPRLGGGSGAEPSEAMQRGTLIHKLLLGKGAELVVIDANDFRTKAAQEQRDAALKVHKLPVLARVLEGALQAALRITKNLADQGVVLRGQSEVAMTWTEQSEDGETVDCRGMMDQRDGTTIYDLKITESASPAKCERRVLDYGYDLQAHAYTAGLRQVLGLDFDPKFVFLFAEPKPPYCVTVAVPSGSVRELGAQRWSRAVNTWARCRRENRWPGYAEKPVLLHVPPWAMSQEMSAATQEAA